MAQSAVTVTNPNPTPPTNLSMVGSTPPDPATYAATVYGTDYHYPAPNLAPFFDDSIANTYPVISQNEGGGVNGTTPPSPVGTLTVFAANHAALATGGTTVAHEGAGNETLFTQSYNPAVVVPIVLKAVGCGPALTAGVMPNPNQLHASSLSPATNPALTTIAPTTSVHGTGAITMTATGTNFTPLSKIALNGVVQPTTFVSATSITALVTPPATAGSVAVTVMTGGVVVTAPQTWTIS
jgi:succinate dehydrogenase/fumarate reductase flavoprotein subunit